MPPKTRRAGAPASAAPGFFQRHDNVYAYVPNLIGYARVILALVGYTMAMHHHQVTLFCYMGSQFLDALDGLAARMLGQSSEFGVPPLSHAAYAAHTPADVAAAA